MAASMHAQAHALSQVQPPQSPCLRVLTLPEARTYRDAPIHAGVYADQLVRWFKHFTSNRFLLWVSEDFGANPTAHMQQLVRWVGLDTARTNTSATSVLFNVREYCADTPADVKAKLLKFYAPHNKRLYGLLAQHGYAAVADRIAQFFDVWP